VHAPKVRRFLRASTIALAILTTAVPCLARARSLPRAPLDAAASTRPRAETQSQAPDAIRRADSGGAADGAGGWYSAWVEARTGGADEGFFVYEVFLQRYEEDGTVASGWPGYGLPILGVANDGDMPTVVADGSGGAIVTWLDYTSGWPMPRAQRVNAQGTRLWGDTGVALSTGRSYRSIDAVLPDGAGGAYVAWYDQGPLLAVGSVVHVQHVGSDGAIAAGWPAAGIPMSSLPGWHWARALFPSGSGVLVLWIQSDEFGGNDSLRFQRLDASGAKLFGPDGMVLTQVNAEMCDVASDGAGGCIVAWSALPLYVHWTVVAQRFDSLGTKRWAPGGNVVCLIGSPQYNPQLLADGEGGVYVSWLDGRTDLELFAQRFTSTGTLADGWPIDGVQVNDSPSPDRRMIRDSLGGLYQVWRETGADRDALWVQRIESDGTIDWPFEGVEITGPDQAAQSYGAHVAPGPAGAMFVDWEDRRGGRWASSRYAQRVEANGDLAWGAGGLKLRGESDCQRGPALDGDGAGAALLAWQEKIGSTWDVRSRELSPLGVPLAISLGVGAAADEQVAPRVAFGSGESRFASWKDERTFSPALFAQRWQTPGSIFWGPGGTQVNSGINRIEGYDLRQDGAGGALMMWGEDGSLNVQRWDAGGSPLWTPGGVAVETLTSFLDPKLHRDGGGGALVTWTEIVPDGFGWPFEFNLRAQRVDAIGNRLWHADGVLVRTIPSLSPYLFSAPDGLGGVFLVSNEGNRFLDSMKIVVNHVTPAGLVDPAWPAGGVALELPYSRKFLTAVCPHGVDGVVVGWMDARGGESFKAYAQRVNAAGQPQWAAGGVALLDTPGAQWMMGLVPSGLGAIAAVIDGRGSSWDVYAQRVGLFGDLPWGAGGVAVCSAPGTQQAIRIVPDGANGAILAWQDQRDPAKDQVVAARIDADGALLWDADGVVSTLASLVSAHRRDDRASITWRVSRGRQVVIERNDGGHGWVPMASRVADASGHIEWIDSSLAASMRYGWRLRFEGASPGTSGEVWLEGVEESRFSILGVSPNPATGAVAAAIALPAAAPVEVAILDLGGRRIWSGNFGVLVAGRHVLPLPATEQLAAGLYFVRVTQAGRQATARFARVR